MTTGKANPAGSRGYCIAAYLDRMADHDAIRVTVYYVQESRKLEGARTAVDDEGLAEHGLMLRGIRMERHSSVFCTLKLKTWDNSDSQWSNDDDHDDHDDAFLQAHYKYEPATAE